MSCGSRGVARSSDCKTHGSSRVVADSHQASRLQSPGHQYGGYSESGVWLAGLWAHMNFFLRSPSFREMLALTHNKLAIFCTFQPPI